MTPATIRPYVHRCTASYGFMDEDKAMYDIGWKQLNVSSSENHSAEYIHKSSSELDGYPYIAMRSTYNGGGYVAELKGSRQYLKKYIAQLKDQLWIDRRTRAVFLEFTIYNTNVNLFGIVTFVAEFTQSAEIAKSYRVEPMNLLADASGAKLVQLAGQIAFACYLVFFIFKEIRKMVRERGEYLKQIWNYNEVAIILLSIACIAVYLYRMIHAKRKTALFKETHGDAYMKFQYIAYWNELLLYMVGWLCFLASLKFLRLLRFNKRMGMLGSILRASREHLLCYGIMFAICFLSFCMMFHLIYMTTEKSFSTLTYTMETMMQMLIGKFGNFYSMKGSSPIIGPMFLVIYVLAVCFILIEMFLVIINNAIEEVHTDVNKQSNEYELVDVMTEKFLEWTGIRGFMLRLEKKTAEKNTCTSPPPVEEPVEFEELLDGFPEKIDRLMSCINDMFVDKSSFESSFLANPGKSQMKSKFLLSGQGKDTAYGAKISALNLGNKPMGTLREVNGTTSNDVDLHGDETSAGSGLLLGATHPRI